MASKPSPLTTSSISSSDNLSYTGSKTPIGILRSDPAAAWPRAASLPARGFDGAPNPSPMGAAFAPAGTAAASRLAPVAVRNCLRSMDEFLGRPFMQFTSVMATAFQKLDLARGIIRCFPCRAEPCLSAVLLARAQSVQGGDGSGWNQQPLGGLLFLL